ncbi:MAG: hypothetical protein MUC44_03565 [Beijerinckiaceae bacterium]|jgi:hypothetical protein|nr:hypothetical protein [Beijerinckiaceae bacterium]
MPLPNRVTPFQSLEASAARGLLMGNRGGRFHDPETRTVPARPWASRQWIICVTTFKDRRRQVWQQGYTELFFCDEVTALAAGHRPCMECRRADALAFRRAAVQGGGHGGGPGASAPLPPCPALDAELDRERRTGRMQRLHRAPFAALPDGAMVRLGGQAHAVRQGQLLAWSHQGYGERWALPGGEAEVLTPPTALAALKAGYAPLWHPSALGPLATD